MPDDPYTLADLARLADVTPRTIRYYVAQGLLPSPEAAGSATRYGEGHLARLRMIRRLQRDHLPLAEIRARLERMGDEDVQGALDALGTQAPDPSLDADDTLAYVRSLMQASNVTPVVRDRAEMTPVPSLLKRLDLAHMPLAVSPPISEPPAPPFDNEPSPTAPAAPASHAALRRAYPDERPAVASKSTWERFVITADVEIHVRRPLDRLANKRVDQLERIARELFEEEP